MALQDLTPQLRTRLRRVEKIVGLFVAVATLVLLAGFAYYLYHTAARKGWFIPKCPYYTFVASGEGLKVGDPVMLMGFAVGEITTITAEPPGSYYKVYVGFEIKSPYYGYVWSDSKVRIAAAGFLGGRALEVTTGVDGAPTVYEDSGRIEILVDGRKIPLAKAGNGAFISPEEQLAITERAQKLLTQVEQALPSILSLTNQLNAILTNTAQLTFNLNQTVADARPLVSNMTVITANLRDPHGSLGEWLIPTNLQAQLTVAMGAANSTITNANSQLTELSASLGQTLFHLASITSNLNAQVQSNDQILTQISDLIVQTDDLIQGLKRHWLLKGAFPQPKGGETMKPILEPQIAPPKEEAK